MNLNYRHYQPTLPSKRKVITTPLDKYTIPLEENTIANNINNNLPAKAQEADNPLIRTPSEDKPIWIINNNGHVLELPEKRSLVEINKQVMKMASIYAPLVATEQLENIHNSENFDNFKQYLDQCISTYKKGNGELRAEQTGRELNLNVETMAARTREELKDNSNSLLQLIEAKFKRNKETKLSGDTVLANTLPTDPESIIAYNIAENGIHLHYDKEFIPYSQPIPPRPLQERVASAILALVSKTNDKNRVVVVQLRDILLEEQARMHFQNFHWKYEIEKALGRLLVDLSNSDIAGWLALNEGTAKQDGIDAFGKVVHPTIEEHIIEYQSFS